MVPPHPDARGGPPAVNRADEELLEGVYPCIGSSDNARFYLLTPHIIAILPFPDSNDNASTSMQSIRFQEAYWRSQRRRGGGIVFMDRVLHQDRQARLVYKTAPEPSLILGFALVTESIFGRALSSLFLGLSAPAVPTRVFSSQREAKPWLMSLLAVPDSSTRR